MRFGYFLCSLKYYGNSYFLGEIGKILFLSSSELSQTKVKAEFECIDVKSSIADRLSDWHK